MTGKIEAPKVHPGAEAETKRRILASALAVFGEKGYHRATMAEIAEAAQVGKGTLYWYFASKEDLFAGIVEQLTEGINAKLKTLLEGPERSFPDLLLAFIQACLAYSSHHRQLVRIFMSAPPGFSEKLREKLCQWRIQFFALNTELIRIGLRTGYFRPGLEVEKVVTALTGILFAFWGRQLMEESRPQVEAEAFFIKEMLLEGIAKKNRGDQIEEEKV